MQSEAAIFHKAPEPQIGKAVPTPIGSMNYNVLRALIEEGQLLKNHLAAEIGVFEAATSQHLLAAFPKLELICVDPFLDYSEHESDKNQQMMSQCEKIARDRLGEFGSRVNILKDFSVNAATKVADASLDFVFIDAIHNYEEVFKDLNAWYSKVRPGGLVSGHDYSWPGVREALENFIKPLGIAAFFTPSTSDVWFFIKPL